MKTLVFLFAMSLSFSASAALEPHFGKISSHGFKYSCTFTNKSSRTLDMKYVTFVFAPVSGENSDYQVQERIDQRVRSGETLRNSVHEPHAYLARHCYYLAR
ncbi:hypothetical protein [Bdellovibrio sp. HCB2-146]|uniref:hypothetical protein n=1 Tax=Bdellovibrio sp. HCB2-146 TaxID=3394362 RepID=UPI0039BD441B